MGKGDEGLLGLWKNERQTKEEADEAAGEPGGVSERGERLRVENQSKGERTGEEHVQRLGLYRGGCGLGDAPCLPQHGPAAQRHSGRLYLTWCSTIRT